jgi:hypothetical protein
MGATLAEVRPDWERLWALTLLYFVIAAGCARLRSMRIPAHAAPG